MCVLRKALQNDIPSAGETFESPKVNLSSKRSTAEPRIKFLMTNIQLAQPFRWLYFFN